VLRTRFRGAGIDFIEPIPVESMTTTDTTLEIRVLGQFNITHAGRLLAQGRPIPMPELFRSIDSGVLSET